MDFARAIEENRRALLDDLDRRIEESLRPFVDALDLFLATRFRGVLPVDWRRQWHDFVAEQAAQEFLVEPVSVRELEDWIEQWARFCGLLPNWEAQAIVTASQKDMGPATAHGLAIPGAQSSSTISAATGAEFLDSVHSTVEGQSQQPVAGRMPTIIGVAGDSPDAEINGTYGLDLTYWQAWWLHQNLKTWTGYAGLAVGLVNKTLTLTLLKKYLWNQGGLADISYDIIKGDRTIVQANLAAVRAALTGKGTFSRNVHFLNEDLTTALSFADTTYNLSGLERFQDGFTCWYEGTINGRLTDTYDFHTIQAGVEFPLLRYFTNWRNTESIPDRWMSNLEDYGFAKSFPIQADWEHTIRVYVNCWTNKPIGTIHILSERDQ